MGRSRGPLRWISATAGSATGKVRELWRRLNAWRSIRFTRGGLLYSLGSLMVGFAAFQTGNNLLYLLFGAMLGLMVVSGWLSERVIRNLKVHRKCPRGVTAGNPGRIHYTIRKGPGRIPAFALEVGEVGFQDRAFVAVVLPGRRVSVTAPVCHPRRGVIHLEAVRISTAFPFGLFRKSRDLPLEGELIIWPRWDRPLRPPDPLGGRAGRAETSGNRATGTRGDYRGLRDYRPGDDRRDIHWRTTARLGHPVVREYEESSAETLWLCVDARGVPGERAEVAVEMAASLAAGAFRKGRRFGLVTPHRVVEAGLGPGQMERVLGALARVEFSPGASAPRPHVSPQRCVLISLRPGAIPGFGDVFTPAGGSQP